jgi:uncharacterized protein YggU (UPF0235/DUF167 family)
VAAPAIEGRATEEARRALAAALGIPAGLVSLRLGERSKIKVFRVDRIQADVAEERLRRALRG